MLIHLRKYIHKWKMGILEGHDYKCFLSGYNQYLEVHHVNKQFSDILDEIMQLNYNKAKDWGEYSQEELDAIGSKIVSAHKDVLGIPLTKKLHRFFHRIYGIKNCSEEQFWKFCEDYRNGLLEEDN